MNNSSMFGIQYQTNNGTVSACLSIGFRLIEVTFCSSISCLRGFTQTNGKWSDSVALAYPAFLLNADRPLITQRLTACA